MTSTIYRRQSMAQLYEKLRAQDDDDDMAWLAQYSPDDKLDDPYVPAVRHPLALSTISSPSPIPSCSAGSSLSDTGFDNESNDGLNDLFNFDSDSDDDPGPLTLELPYAPFDPSSNASLIFQRNDSTVAPEPTDTPCISSVSEISFPGLTAAAPLGDESYSSPAVIPSVSLLPSPVFGIASRRITRSTQKSSTGYRSSPEPDDANDDAYSESEGNGSEDEYIPSPTLGSKRRNRSTRSVSHPVAAPSQNRNAGNPLTKRPRNSPFPRNVQATPGETFASKNNPWACPYCKWVQRNHRTPDLKRHIRTHTRLQRPAQWVCCGVPVKDAGLYSIPADASAYIWAGETMIGGCCKEFSRRDALKRHLDNDHINCIGNFSAFASISEDDAS